MEASQRFAAEHKIDYKIETSAKTGQNIQTLFVDIAKSLYVKYKEKLHRMVDEETTSISSIPNNLRQPRQVPQSQLVGPIVPRRAKKPHKKDCKC